MGNISIGNGTKTVTIGTGTKSITIGSPPQLQIVEEMFLTYQLVNNQWFFSLNGVTQDIKDLLDNNYKMQIQLIRNRGYKTIRGNEYFYKSQPRTFIRPTFPSKVRDNYPATIEINSFENNIYKNMNLTSWVNGLISKLSVIRNRNSGSEFIFKDNNGFWFTQLKFCILINNSYFSKENNNYITLNFYNNNNENINTNYSLLNNTIDIYSV
jgi:hypothetical protein